MENERRDTASLNPQHAESSDRWLEPFRIDLSDSNGTSHLSASETEPKHFKAFNADLMNALDLLSEKHRVAKVRVARLAHEHGVDRLWVLPGVGEFRALRRQILEYGDSEDVNWLRTNDFYGLNKGLTLKTTLDLNKSTSNKCSHFGSLIGISASKAHQLAMMVCLFEVDAVPNRNREAMFNILTEFRDWIPTRVAKAKEKLTVIGQRAPGPEIDTSKLSFRGLLE